MKIILRTSLLLLVPVVIVIAITGQRAIRDTFLVDPVRETNYDDTIAYHAVVNNLEPELLKAVIWKESRFKPWAIGQKGEIGLMQLMQPAVTDWAKRHRHAVPSKGELKIPEINIEIGAWYLAWCGRLFSYVKGDREALQLAIYNAGVTNVKAWIPPEGSEEEFTVDSVRFSSTRDYIMEIKKRRDYYVEENAVKKETTH